jgi:hypothetical protein
VTPVPPDAQSSAIGLRAIVAEGQLTRQIDTCRPITPEFEPLRMRIVSVKLFQEKEVNHAYEEPASPWPPSH